MRLIDHDKIIVSPIHTREIYTIGFSACSPEICMIQYIIIESIFYERIIFIVIEKCEPVISELLRTEYEDALISFLIIFYNSKCREGFSESDAIGKDTTIKSLELIDYSEYCIFLKIVELIPYC